MPRYFILQGATGTWAVVDTIRTEYPRHVCRGTKPEAEVCAFALNAVADGRTLLSTTLSPSATALMLTEEGSLYVGIYDGPTEGVAP